MISNYFVDLPYPQIKITKKNSQYAKLLLSDYAGEVSELTSMNLYLYQSIFAKDPHNTYSEIVKGIFKVEVHHLIILGKTINLLGYPPTFKAPNRYNEIIPWTSEHLNTTNKLKEMLKEDIRNEEKTILNYTNHLYIINDKNLKEILERIILDEKQHLKCFEDLYKLLFSENTVTCDKVLHT